MEFSDKMAVITEFLEGAADVLGAARSRLEDMQEDATPEQRAAALWRHLGETFIKAAEDIEHSTKDVQEFK